VASSGFWNQLFNSLIAPFAYLRKYASIFKSADKRGKTAIVLSSIFPGLGTILYHSWIKPMLKLVGTGLFVYYMTGPGYRFLVKATVFSGLHMQLYHILMLIGFVYFYFHNLRLTLIAVEKGEVITPAWFVKSKQVFIEKGRAWRDYTSLWRHGSAAERWALLSPFFAMGLYQIIRKRPIKGLLLLLIEGLFIYYMVATGIFDIIDFFVLDTDFRPSTFNLVYGFIAFVLTGVFLYVYTHNIKTVTIYVKDRMYEIKPFLQELKALGDHKLYVSLLTAPIIGVLVFTVVPLLFMISIAFTGYQGASLDFLWTGFESFRSLILVQDNFATLLSVIRWTLIWAFFATFTNYFGGILLAALINKKIIKLKKMWRTVFIITMATPQFVSLLIMYQMFGTQGPINQFLLNLGIIQNGINFWGVQWQARLLVIIVNMWIGIPYLMVLTSGILMNIPKDLYEAATVDGASRTQQFFKITMPYMLYVTGPLLITGFISNINNFNVIYLLTQGRPYGVGLVNAGGTDILITWLYQLTRTHRLYNMSAAIGIIIFLMSAGFSLAVYRRTAAYKREGELR
jgi:arabinogalactan oligomer/maltooligosaccharide transport system permease protein